MSVLNSWKEEKRSAWLYRQVSDAESGTPRQVLFLELARAADDQAQLWAAEAAKTGMTMPASYRPDLRTRLVARLIPIFGIAPLRRMLAAMKVRGMSLYNAPLPDGASGTARTREAHHGKDGGGALRAAVFGVNDGLVSNASLILGIAGASPDPAFILLAGAAGLLAGAFSMAAGEYISVRAQREYYEYQITLEREELTEYPQEEVAELTLIYTAKGLPQGRGGASGESPAGRPGPGARYLGARGTGPQSGRARLALGGGDSLLSGLLGGRVHPAAALSAPLRPPGAVRHTGGHRFGAVRRRLDDQPVHRTTGWVRRLTHAADRRPGGRGDLEHRARSRRGPRLEFQDQLLTSTRHD